MPGPDRTQPTAGSSQHPYKVQPPRPPNAWILYRTDKFNEIRATQERISQAAVSKIIATMWKNETDLIRRQYERMADDRKAQHQQLYPDYRFCPQRKEDKARAKEERKQNRRAKKSKTPDATSLDADADVGAHANAVPRPLPFLYMHQASFVPGYQPNMIPQPPYPLLSLPEMHYGYGGPSPPISAAPSPAPCETSDSPGSHSYPEESVASSSSSPSVEPSPGSGSRVSSSSSQLPPNPTYLSPLPSSHQLSPSPYATQPLTPLIFQSSVLGELPIVSPQPQYQLAENAHVPTTPVFSTQMSNLHSQNSQEVAKFNVAVNQTQSVAQCPHPSSSSEAPIPRTEQNRAHEPQNGRSSVLLTKPPGDMQVVMGVPSPTVDHSHEEYFVGFDYEEWERQILGDDASSSAPVAPSSVFEDLEPLFRAPDNPAIEEYIVSRQRQPGAFSMDMSSFFDFEAAGIPTEDTSSTAFSDPIPTTIAPQQVQHQNTQLAATMPIFTPMTNTTAAPDNSYVPPAGAIYSSMRRVGATWKPSPTPLPAEESIQSWTIPTN